MRLLFFVNILIILALTNSVKGRLTRSTADFALLEPQFLPGTITTLIQTARKIIGSNVEPESVIGEGSSQTNPSESERLYKDAVSATISVYQRSMNDATNNRLKQIDAASSIPIVQDSRDPACSVMITTELALTLDPKNIFDVNLLDVRITKDDLLFSTDIKNPESLVRSFSLNKIEVPLESVQNSRKCFRMYFDGSPVVMCAKSDEERNNMMNKLTEAVFCKNSGISFSKTTENIENTEFPDSSLGIPALTTKDLRWIEQVGRRQLQMAGKVQSNVMNWLQSKGTQDIVVKNSLGLNPVIIVNGEKVV